VQTRGEFGGLGIEVTQEDGFVQVSSRPWTGHPGDGGRVEAGDFITHVDGEALLGLTLDQAVDMMRGPVGSEIVITIVREGEEQPFDITIVRDTHPLTAVRSRLEGNTAIMRISTFNDQTYPNLRDGLEELIEEVRRPRKPQRRGHDLRNNAGGLLSEAIRVTDAFLDQGEIVSTRGREPQDGDRFNATSGDMIDGLPIVVLINGGSASASEIVAGALQDHRRAIDRGHQQLRQGLGPVGHAAAVGSGAMRLTTSLYYTPSGRSIQALGVAPDILVEQREPIEVSEEEEERAVRRNEASLRGALQNSTLSEDQIRQLEEEQAIAEASARLRNEDYQLAYAIDILTGLNALGPNAQ
jgi:carboxyl-terminal processing protease